MEKLYSLSLITLCISGILFLSSAQDSSSIILEEYDDDTVVESIPEIQEQPKAKM